MPSAGIAPSALEASRFPRLRTVGDLRRFGVLLRFSCFKSSGRRLLDALELPFGNSPLISTAHNRMKCIMCGGSGGEVCTRPTGKASDLIW